MASEILDEKAIFNVARQIGSPDARAEYLRQACEAEPGLRERVQDLLRAYEEQASFLESPPPVGGAPTIGEPIRERPGTIIGPYKLLQQIGEGGMGVVWMAEQTQPVQRKVALKVIKPGMDSRQVIARFEAEQQALALMDHVNIARVFDAGTTESGRPYFVMELVHGVPITQYCDDNHLSPRERLELFVPVCQAIQHAHQKGIIHRDVKPSNVMVTLYDGKPVPKVIDFGVAKATEQRLTERTLFTQYGAMVGTLEYMSPEQAEMSALGVDTRSDIYSLGVLLYELLTGSTPLTHKRMKEAAYAEILRMIKEEEPPRPSTRLSDSGEALASISANRHTEPARLTKLLRGELDWIVMKTLEKDRNRRYETAKDFAADVQRYLGDEPVQACPPSARYRLRKFARRNKAALATALAVALAVLFAVVGLAISNVRIGQEKDQKEQALRQAEANEEAANAQRAIAQDNAQKAEAEKKRAIEQEGIAKAAETRARAQELTARRRFYASQISLAHQAWESGNPARLLELLEGLRAKFDEPDMRTFEWYYLWGLCHKNLRFTLRGSKPLGHCVAYSPDGKIIATGGTDGTIKLWDAITGQERGSLQGYRLGWQRVAFSPDGKTLAQSTGPTGKEVTLWDLAKGQIQATLHATSSVRCLAFSPDGKTLAAGTEDRSVRLWNVASRHERSTFPAHSAPVESLAFSPDGKTLATASWGDSLVKVWDLNAAAPRPVLQLGQSKSIVGLNGTHSLAFSPDGKTLATGIADGKVKLWDLATGQVRDTNQGDSGQVFSVAFSPDGKTLAFGTQGRSVKLWNLATRRERTLAHLGAVRSLAFAPDGMNLSSASDDGTVKVWDLAPTQGPMTLQHDGSVTCLAFSPDGKTVATASGSGGGSVRLWDAVSGQLRNTLEGPAGLVYALAFAPDGMILASGGVDQTVRLWNVASGRELTALSGHTGWARSLAFSSDGSTLASGSDDQTVRLWDLAEQRTRTILKVNDGVIAIVAFSPDGETLAAAGQSGKVTLWDTVTGTRRSTLRQEHWGWLWALAFSPDGKLLAIGSESGTVRLYDVSNGDLRTSLRGHTAHIRCLAFFQGGATLGTASEDRTVKLWDVATGQERMTLKGHADLVSSVAISPDGRTLATASADGTVKLWRAAREPDALACKKELDRDDPESPVAQNNAADRLWAEGRLPEAEDTYRKALARFGKLAAHFRDAPEYRERLAVGHFKFAMVLARNGHPEEANASYRKAIELDPKNPRLLNALAWSLATCPEPKSRDATRAVKLAEKAVNLAPTEGNFWNTLAVAHYRAGDWKAAVASLEKSLDLRKGGDIFDWLFLAMAHWQLGEKAEARKWYDRAVVWMDKNKPKDEELRRFREEAAKLLKVEDQPKPVPMSK